MNRTGPTGIAEPSLLHERLMALNEETFTAGQYDAAYHALMAALHIARDQHDPQALAAIARRAGDQLQSIDQHAPAYRHSSASAHARGNAGIFDTLIQQAQMWERVEVQSQLNGERAVS